MPRLTDYTGNANLGLGANPGIPAVSPTVDRDLDVINQTARDISLMNAARNKQLFDQKIRDRDDLLKALDDGSIQMKDMLEQDDPIVHKAVGRITDAYNEMIDSGGLHNLKAVRKYKNAVQEAKSHVTQAQARFDAITKLDDAIAKETIHERKEKLKQHREQYLSQGFWGDYVPPDEFQNYDSTRIDKYYSKETEEDWLDDKKNKIGKDKYYNYGVGQQVAASDFLTDAGRENQKLLYDGLQRMGPLAAFEYLTSINNRLKNYDNSIPVKDGRAKTTGGIKWSIDPKTKELSIQESLPDLAAKIGLAQKERFFNREEKFDNTRLDYKASMARLGLDWTKFNYAKDEDKFGAATVINEAIDTLKKGTPEIHYNKDSKKNETLLRVGEPTLMQKFGNIDKDGNVTNVPDYVLYNPETDQILLSYKDDRKKNNIKTIPLDQRTWLKEIAKRSFPNKDIGKVNTLVDDILDKSGNSLYKLSQGQTSETTKPTTKKEISRKDIPSKAAAAGYSVKEYEALLKQNGVIIKE